MNYTFNRNGTAEQVTPEKWGWEVVYRNKDMLQQFDHEGIFHQFQEINQENVMVFSMYKLADPRKRYDLFIHPGMQIFHFYRNFVFNMLTQDEKRMRVFVFGWKKRGTEEMCYHYILPNDNLVISAGGEIAEIPVQIYSQQ